jgi:ferredoxin
MAKVKINKKTLEIPAGVRFGELHHEIEKAGVEFGCTDGQCGVCVCTVKKGLECLAEPSDTEEETLWRIGEYEESRRLTCQLVIEKEGCEIELETD